MIFQESRPHADLLCAACGFPFAQLCLYTEATPGPLHVALCADCQCIAWDITHENGIPIRMVPIGLIRVDKPKA